MDENNISVSLVVSVENNENLDNYMDSIKLQNLDNVEIILIGNQLDAFKTEVDFIIDTECGIDNHIKDIFEMASGDYLLFLKSSTLIKKDILKNLYYEALYNHIDILSLDNSLFNPLELDLNTEVKISDNNQDCLFNHENSDVIFSLYPTLFNKFISRNFLLNKINLDSNYLLDDITSYYYLYFNSNKNMNTAEDVFEEVPELKCNNQIDLENMLSFFINNNLYQKNKKNILNILMFLVRLDYYSEVHVRKDYFSIIKNKIESYERNYFIKEDLQTYLNSYNKIFYDKLSNYKYFDEFKEVIVQSKENKEYKLSIIIPVYNSEKKYVFRSFKSIFNQTMKFEDIEVIYVDDGSSFLEGKSFLEQLYDLFENVKLYSLNENSGPGNARNIGILNSSSDYIMFLDHDDYYVEGACELLFKYISEESIDVVCGNYINLTVGAYKYVDWPKKGLKNKVIKIDSFKDNMNIFKLYPAIWTKIFRKEFLLKENITFKNYKSGEDLLFYQESLFKAKGMIFIDEIIVVYKVRKDTNRTTSISYDNSKDIIFDLLKVFENSYKLFLKYAPKYSHIPLNNLYSLTRNKLLVNKFNFNEFIEICDKTKYLFKKYLQTDKTNIKEDYRDLYNNMSNQNYNKAYSIYLDLI